MQFFPLLFLIFGLPYFLVTVLFAIGLRRLGAQRQMALATPHPPSFSVLIPCYNDATAAQRLLHLAEAQPQPTVPFEILIIDDHSESADGAALEQLARNSSWPVRYLRSKNTPGKKGALAWGFKHARFPIIVQSDADCEWQAQFLEQITAAFSDKSVSMVLGSVRMRPAHSWLSRFAALDFLSLQMAGASMAALGKAIMGNGAALAYRREVLEQHGQVGNELSSGDDVFLIQALAQRAPEALRVNTSAVVDTPAPLTWREFLRQRIRWGGKTTAYPSRWAQFTALAVAWVSWLFITLLLGSLFLPGLWQVALLLLILKAGIDYALLRSYARLSGQRRLLKIYPLAALVYPFYLALTTLLILLGGKSVRWKGRPIKTSAHF